ncbi:hypothetical protein Tco_0645376 [Tanacetum coccineum]
MAAGTVRQSLQNLTVEVRDLPTIDPEELIKLMICKRVLDIVSWVAEGPPRQQGGAAGGGAEMILEEATESRGGGATENGEPRVSQHVRIEGVDDREHARYSTWMVDRMTKLMESRGMGYESLLSRDESNTHVLERFYTSAGNPVKEILLKLKVDPHGFEGNLKMVVKMSQVHNMAKSQDGKTGLCLVDDLKVFKITISLTSQDKGTSSCLKSKDTTTYSQDKRHEVYELKTKDKA